MKVFLSYPSEHFEQAREVKSFVRSVDVECWFDQDSLVAGQDWDRVRAIALSEADLVIVLCSSVTIERNGVYQREINEALQLVKDRRLGTVYIIPLRIENVELPPELNRFQRVDYFDVHWRRKLAAGLAQGVIDKCEDVPPALVVAAAQPDEGGIIPRAIAETLPAGTIEIDWINYTLAGDYWDFVNGAITSRALGAAYQTRRQFAEWWKQEGGSSYELSISEFYRRGELVSLTFASGSYFAHQPYPSFGIETLNFLGQNAGIVSASDLFMPDIEVFNFLTNYVNLDLRRQNFASGYEVDISYYADVYGWNFFDHFNFNSEGMRLNFSSKSGLPHVLSSHEVYLPWKRVSQFLAPVAHNILIEPGKD